MATPALLKMIDRLLKQLEEARRTAQIGIIDLEELAQFTEPGDIEQLSALQQQIQDYLREQAERQGLEQGKLGYQLTPKAYRLFQAKLDLVFDVKGTLVKVQVKSAWRYERDDCYLTDNRRTKTNRRNMVRDLYRKTDFDFALVHVEELNLFYVFPVDVFIAYASSVCLVESDKRQRKPRSAEYREAWDLISNWAARGEILVRTPVKVGKASGGGNPEPSSSDELEKV